MDALAEFAAVIEGKHRILISFEELEFAIDLQTKKVSALKSQRDKQAVYEMVLLECFKLLKSGKIEGFRSFDETTTEGQLEKQVAQVAEGIYQEYVNNLPLEYLIPIQEATTEQVLLMQKALDDKEDAIMELALLMKSRGKIDAYEYWLMQISDKNVDESSRDNACDTETVIAPTVQVLPEKENTAPELTLAPQPPLLKISKGEISNESTTIAKSAHAAEPTLQSSIKSLDARVLHFFSLQDGIIRQKHPIMFVKLSAIPVSVALSVMYSKYDKTILVYALLHSISSISWFVTTNMFPLNTFERRLARSEIYESILAHYSFFLPPLLICYYDIQLSNLFLAIMAITCLMGDYVIAGSIIQKSCMSNQLITNGFFKYVRNPIIFGEIVVYFCFALMSYSFLGFLPVLSFFFFVWEPSIRFKEEILAAKYSSEWLKYRQSTKRALPFLY